VPRIQSGTPSPVRHPVVTYVNLALASVFFSKLRRERFPHPNRASDGKQKNEKVMLRPDVNNLSESSP
jgi:hypothetical protein